MTTLLTFRDCLVGEVLSNAQDWLGEISPGGLRCLLAGAEVRAWLLQPSPVHWRIFGPLHLPEFTSELSAKTGITSVSFAWSTILEVHFRSPLEAMAYIEKLCCEHFDAEKLVAEDARISNGCSQTEEDFWRSFFRRPQLYIGCFLPWHVYLFLMGMSRGGDWLGLPKMDFLADLLNAIESSSRELYGTAFGMFRLQTTEVIISTIESAYNELQSGK